MNRKTLVLPAVVGLLAPVLAACGGSDGGSGGGDAIVVGTTDRFTATKDAPAPLDPAYAYDVGTWNILRQTVQTLMSSPRGGGEPVPEAAQSCRFTDTGNERYRCTLRERPEVRQRRRRSPRRTSSSPSTAPAPSRPTPACSPCCPPSTPSRRRATTKSSSTSRPPDATFPYKLSTPVAGIVNPDDYDEDKLRDGFDVDGSGPYTLKAEVKGDQIVKAVFTKNPNYKGTLKVNNDEVDLRSFADADGHGQGPRQRATSTS